MRQLKKTNTITDRRSKSIELYLRDVNNYSRISIDEEVELAQKIRKGGREGEKAKQKLVEANLRFVISVANQYAHGGIELADIIEEGNLGLIRAAESFDETRGFKFTSYAVWWIRQSILQAFSEQLRLIKLPLNIQGQLMKFWKANDEMLQKEGRPITPEEFGELQGMDSKQVKIFAGALVKMTSLDCPLAEDSDKTILDTIAVEDEGNFAERGYLSKELDSIMKCLTPVERQVITMTFGIGQTEASLNTTAEVVGLSRERVRQIRVRAISKLQNVKEIKALREYL